MLIARFVVGPVSTNCYIVACNIDSEAMVIDPDLREEDEIEAVLRQIGEKKLGVKYIVNTHGHTDHIGGNRRLKEATGAEIVIHEDDAPVLAMPWKRLMETAPAPRCVVCGAVGVEIKVARDADKAVVACRRCGFVFDFISSPPPDRVVRNGDLLKIDGAEFEVIHTPGHSPGEICIYSRKEKTIFTGDTLFQGSVGRTDLPGSCEEDMKRSLEKLAELPDNVVVYPGHGEPTTIGEEKSPRCGLGNWFD
jgi:hydroxyacylglutathione hydrolase